MSRFAFCFDNEGNDHSFIQNVYRNRRRLRDEISDFNKKESGNVHFDPSHLVAGVVAFTDQNYVLLEENEDCYDELEPQYEGNNNVDNEENETNDTDSCFEEYYKQISDSEKESAYENTTLIREIYTPPFYHSKTETYNSSNNDNSSLVLPTSSASFLSSTVQQEQVLNQILHGRREEYIESQGNNAEAQQEEEVLSDVESEAPMDCPEKTVDLVDQIREVERLVRQGETSEFTLNMVRKVAKKGLKNTMMMSTPTKQLYSATIVVNLKGEPINPLTGTIIVSFGWSEEEAMVNALEVFRQKEMKRTMSSLSKMSSKYNSGSDLTDFN